MTLVLRSPVRLPADELALYLSSGVEYLQSDALGRPGDLIKWWWDHRDTYLQLQAMATDYLSIPCEFYYSTNDWLTYCN
jgi:hypothetical protein